MLPMYYRVPSYCLQLYWIAPIVGGMAAALIYDFIFAVNASVDKFKACFRMDYDDADFDQDGNQGGSITEVNIK